MAADGDQELRLAGELAERPPALAYAPRRRARYVEEDEDHRRREVEHASCGVGARKGRRREKIRHVDHALGPDDSSRDAARHDQGYGARAKAFARRVGGGETELLDEGGGKAGEDSAGAEHEE